MIQIQLNGDTREVAEGTSIAALLDEMQLDNRMLAVERNKQLVPRTEHSKALLVDGDRLEVVTLVGGG